MYLGNHSGSLNKKSHFSIKLCHKSMHYIFGDTRILAVYAVINSLDLWRRLILRIYKYGTEEYCIG